LDCQHNLLCDTYFSALKESGYESDSTLVFKRRDENLQNQLSPAEQKLAYKTIQKGGEVPLHGLRKPAPERPKGESYILVLCVKMITQIVGHCNVYTSETSFIRK
jgi:hypothetical protein